MPETFKRLRDMLCEITGMHPDEVTLRLSLGQLRYAQWAALLAACEQAFHIAIADEEVCDLHRVADVVRCIDAHLADGPLDYTPPDDVTRASWYYD
jgi:hypothetical protein